MRWTFLAVAMLTPLVASAQAPERIDIALSSFKYEPSNIRLHHGRAYTLHFVNRTDGGHDFVAKAFFTAAKVDGGAVKDGAIALSGGQAADIRLTAPAPGRYPVHCSHFMHSTFGMKGEIIVD